MAIADAPPETPRPARAAAAGWVAALSAWWRASGPYLVASVLLVAGYLHYRPGTAYVLSPDHYRTWAFPAFRYSDIIWLYLRDGLAGRPIPYLDYPLEYPPLTGLVSWLLGFAPDLPAYFALAWGVNAASLLGAIWALRRIPGANPWYLAAAPALFFYPGHQFDPVAVGVAALALAALATGRSNVGALGLAAGVSLKLFPAAFLGARGVDLLRQRRWRQLAETVAIAVAVTVAANLPVALANRDNWAFFIRWNRDRLADSGIWVLWRDVPTETLTSASLWTVVAGGGLIALWGLRCGGPLSATLGSTALLWWLFANKTFTTHLVLWVFLAVALLRPPLWLWLAVVAVDIVGFQVGNYLNLYNVPAYQNAPLVHAAVVNIYDPLQLARSLVLLACVGWGLLVIWRQREREPWPVRPPFPRPPLPVTGLDGLLAPQPRLSIAGRSVPAWVPAALGYACAAIAFTWPLAANLRSATVAGFDPLLQVWLSQWVQHALATDPLALYQANIFHPFSTTLAYTDANVPGALLAWPLDALLGDPVLTNNLMTLAAFVLGGAGVFAVVTALCGNAGAAWVAGLAWAFAPWRMVHLWHLNWLQGAWLPWVLLAFLCVLQRPTRARGALLGLAVSVLTLTSFYFAVQVALLLGVLLACALAADRRARTIGLARSLAVGVAVTGVLCVPLYLPYLQVRAEQGLQRTLAEAEEYKALPESWLTLAPWDAPNPLQRALGVRAGENDALTTVGQERHADGHRHGEIVIEDALYPGLFTLLLALAGLVWWKPRWPAVALGIVAAVSALLTLGPTLGPGTDGPPLPYGWLFEHAPFFTAMRVPARLGGLALLALAVLAGLGATALWRRLAPRLSDWGALGRAMPIAATAALSGLVAWDLAALPAPLEPLDRSPEQFGVYAWLAGQPDGAVMEFPAESIFADPAGSSVRRHLGLSMLGSTLHWKPLVNGNSGFIPRSHSDLLDAFTGNLPRDDGSLALRVSHVDRDSVPMLRQLGVRYLLFHMDQYRPEDWPAVVAALRGAEPLIEPAGVFGNVAVFTVALPVAPPPRPAVTLHAPTLLDPESSWGPVLTVDNPGGDPAILALTRPTTLSATWHDAAGRLLHREGWNLRLPATTDAARLDCTVSGCRAALGPAGDLPDPGRSPWRPEEPGHYVVRLALSGDMPLACTVDLDVLDSRADVLFTSPDDPFRWAACTAESPYPVNDPGRPAIAVDPPSVTFADGEIAVATRVATRHDQEIRGWWLLAPPGDPAPWRSAAWRSPVEQRLAAADEPASFAWLEPVPADLPDGVYGLTLWFHRATESGWVHADGGRFGIGPLVIEDGQARWAGPVRAGALPTLSLRAGSSSVAPLAVTGTDGDRSCAADWRLENPDTGQEVASGHAGDCGAARIAVPPDLAPGAYRLRVDLFAVENGRRTLSDGLSAAVVVTEPIPAFGPR